jgi:hypothetical protein
VLSPEQREFLWKISLRNHIGEEGASELEDIFKDGLDLTAITSSIANIAKEVGSAVERASQIKAGLDGLVEPLAPLTEEALIKVVFRGGAAIENIVDLRRWASEWHDIGRGIAMVANASPEEIRVVGAKNGSIIITLAATYAVAQVAATVILKSLEIVEKVMNLRKIHAEIKSLDISNKSLADEARKAVLDESESGAENAAENAMQELGLVLDGEQRAVLQKSVKRLISFIEKGGSVDVVLLPFESTEGKNAEADIHLNVAALADKAERIRRIESKIEAIGYESTDAQEDASEEQ